MGLRTTPCISESESTTLKHPACSPSLNLSLFNTPTIAPNALTAATSGIKQAIETWTRQKKQELIQHSKHDLSLLIRFLHQAGAIDENQLVQVVDGGFRFRDVIALIDQGMELLSEEIIDIARNVSGQDWPLQGVISITPEMSSPAQFNIYDEVECAFIRVEAELAFDLEVKLDVLPLEHQQIVVAGFSLMSRTFGDCLVGSDLLEADYFFEDARTEIEDVLKNKPDATDDEVYELLDEETTEMFGHELYDQITVTRLRQAVEYQHIFKPLYNEHTTQEAAESILRWLWKHRHEAASKHPYMAIIRQIAHLVRQMERKGLNAYYGGYERIDDHGHPFEAFTIGFGLPMEDDCLFRLRNFHMEAGELFCAALPLRNGDAFIQAYEKLKMLGVQMGIMLKVYKESITNE